MSATQGAPGTAAAGVQAARTAGAGALYSPDSPGVTPDDESIRAIIQASDTTSVSDSFERAANELHHRDPDNPCVFANFSGMDLLSAKEAAITLLHAEMILPTPNYLKVFLGTSDVFVEKRKNALAITTSSGYMALNPDFFGERRRSTLLGTLQHEHDRHYALGGGHYGGAPVLLHEKMHAILFTPNLPAAQNVNEPDKSGFKATGPEAYTGAVNAPSPVEWAETPDNVEAKNHSGVTKPDRNAEPETANSPHALAPIGGQALEAPRERWAEGARLVASFGSAAPKEAKEVWESQVFMDADRWQALDRQRANLYRTLDTLYEQTDPATGLQLGKEDREHRALMIDLVSKGLGGATGFGVAKGRSPVVRDGARALHPMVHDVNALGQEERDAMPVLPTWVGKGRGRGEDGARGCR